jgi:hypothetical protein
MSFINEKYLAQGHIEARNGISIPHPINLDTGQVIYRFYNSSRARNPVEAANGAWWIEYEYFQKIKHFAIQYGYSFSYAARLFAAILYEWSEVDSYVRCQIKTPLKALKGRGKQVHSSGKDSRDTPTMTPMQNHLEIYQLYVPGFGGSNSISSSTIKVLGSQKL